MPTAYKSRKDKLTPSQIFYLFFINIYLSAHLANYYQWVLVDTYFLQYYYSILNLIEGILCYTFSIF